MIKFHHEGDFTKTTKFLKNNRTDKIRKKLEYYGKIGVDALSDATPVDTGLTAKSWSYEVKVTEKSATISWNNSNFNDGVPIALVIQYGHAMPNGGYVQGIDYINPALKPIFDSIVTKVWKEVVEP